MKNGKPCSEGVIVARSTFSSSFGIVKNGKPCSEGVIIAGSTFS